MKRWIERMLIFLGLGDDLEDDPEFSEEEFDIF